MSPGYSLLYVPVWAAVGPRHATVVMALLLRLALASGVLAWLRREHGDGPALVAALWVAAVPCVAVPQVGVSLAAVALLVWTAALLGRGRGGWSVALAVLAAAWLALLRPELTVLPAVVLAAGAVGWWRARGTRDEAEAGRTRVRIAACALLGLGLVGGGVLYTAGHAPDPHRGEWALRAAYGRHGDYDETFPGASSALEAARTNPGAMARHVGTNASQLGRRLHAVVGIAPLRGGRAVAWIAVAATLALVGLGAWRGRRRGWERWAGPHGAALLLGAAGLTVLAALVIEPVPRYLAPVVGVLALPLATAVAIVARVLERLPGSLGRVGAAVALIAVPLALARPAIRASTRTETPVRDVLAFLEAGEDIASIHGHAALSFAAYLGGRDITATETYVCPDPDRVAGDRPDAVLFSAARCGRPFETWAEDTPALDGYQCLASGDLVGCRVRDPR